MIFSCNIKEIIIHVKTIDHYLNKLVQNVAVFSLHLMFDILKYNAFTKKFKMTKNTRLKCSSNCTQVSTQTKLIRRTITVFR